MSNIIVFVDNVGRTVLGTLASSSETFIAVKNPAVINVVPGQNGQLQVQVIPLFFTEFVSAATRTAGTTWVYNTNSIALAQNLELTEQLLEQYTKIFNPAPAIVTPDAPVVKLF